MMGCDGLWWVVCWLWWVMMGCDGLWLVVASCGWLCNALLLVIW